MSQVGRNFSKKCNIRLAEFLISRIDVSCIKHYTSSYCQGLSMSKHQGIWLWCRLFCTILCLAVSCPGGCIGCFGRW
jgi:hypothetical protein